MSFKDTLNTVAAGPLQAVRTTASLITESSSLVDFQKNLVKRGMNNHNALRRLLNIWPPLRGAGVRVSEISEDSSFARVTWKRTWRTVNMHGVAFGGTLFSMADVMVGTLLARRMGSDYEVWTRSASFQYVSPGRDGAYLDVEFDDELIEWITSTIDIDGYCNLPYSCAIKNPDGSTVGISHQELHARPRGGAPRSEQPQQAATPRGYILEHLATATAWHAFHDRPEIMTRLMSTMRRIPDQGQQLSLVCETAIEKDALSVDKLRELGIPDEYLS